MKVISVVVPTYNEEGNIMNLYHSNMEMSSPNCYS